MQPRGTRRAAFHTSRVSAVETTLSLGKSLLLGKTDVHLLNACCGTINWVEFAHNATLNGCAVFWLHALAQFVTPLCVTVGKFAKRSVLLHLLSLGCKFRLNH